MKLLPSIFKQKKTKRSSSGTSANSWKWIKPLKHLKTLSFYVKARMVMVNNNPNFVFSTTTTHDHHQHVDTSKLTTMLDSSWSQSRHPFPNPSLAPGRGDQKNKSMSSKSGELMLESAVKAIKTKRLLFDPGSSNNSNIVGSARFVFQDCVVQAIETPEPYVEFRVSMEEMVAAYGLIKKGENHNNNNNVGEKENHWEYLEGLLTWYLRMNEKRNHGVIVEAFIDMYTALPNSCPSSCYNASASSSKSKEWWDIKISETYLRSDKEILSSHKL